MLPPTFEIRQVRRLSQSSILVIALLAVCFDSGFQAHAQPPSMLPGSEDTSGIEESPSEVAENKLAFSFNGAPWREVLNWLADESGLALHVADLPSGSFTYSDPEQFSTEEAISRLNLFLIPQGFSVVRRGQLLSVITLGDPRSMQQLDAMAEMVTRDSLVGRSSNAIVKCMLPLGDVQPEIAIAELKPLMLMSTPVILPQSNQLIVVDTAEKLRSVIAVIDAMQNVPEDEIVVKRLRLRYTDFETLVAVAGTHLGMQGGGMQGGVSETDDLSISTDVNGTSLYVSGTKPKVEKLEALLKVIDVADETEAVDRDLILKSHPVSSGSLQSVYDVLVTMLSDKEIRLSMEAKTSSIVALAGPEIHQQIESTIEELRAPSVEFAVVDLQTLDPYFAITLLSEMFGQEQADNDRDYQNRNDDRQPTVEPPRIDADPENRRLFVRGTKEQIREVQQIVQNLDTTRKSGEAVRVVPLKGTNAKKLLDFAREAWEGRNDVIVLPPSKNSTTDVIERALNASPPRGNRVANGQMDKAKRSQTSDGDQYDSMPIDGNAVEASDALENDGDAVAEDEIVTGVRSTRVASPFDNEDELIAIIGSDLTGDDHLSGRGQSLTLASENGESNEVDAAAIRSQLTPQGILLQSDDLSALDEFEQLLLQVGNGSQGQISPPVAYYLKYVNAEEAVRMLADLLDGENALASSPSGSLVNGGSVSASGSGYFGSLLYSRDGRTTVSAGSATIVSDARLNRLIVQGTTDDIAVVEKYLKLIDKGESITNIETFGQSRVVELVHSKATDVAEVIREAFRGRILGEEQNQQPQQRPRDPREAGRSDDRGSEDEQSQRSAIDKPTRGRQAEMTLAVHEPSNSLIITAPEPLFKEVERLIQTVDTNSEQVIQVIPAGAGVDMEAIMQRVMGLEGTSTGRSSSTNNSRDRSRDRSSDRTRNSRR